MAFGTLGTGGIHFLRNGIPTFLWGPTYFDVLDWHLSDITTAVSYGANVFRIILDKQFAPDGPSGAQSIFNSNGSIKTTETNIVHNFINACNTNNAAVEIIILVADGIPNSASWLTTATARANAVTNATNAFKTHTNVMFDVANEYTYGTAFNNVTTELQPLLNAAFAAYSTGIIGASGGGGLRGQVPDGYWIEYDTENLLTPAIDAYVATGASFGAPHNCRDRQWPSKCQSRATAIRAYLDSIGYNKPLYFSEEGRVGSTEDGDPSAAELVQAVVGSRDGGCAGYIFHSGASFDLSAFTMFDQFTPDELAAFSNIQEALGPAPDITPPSPPTGIMVL
ncbi:cellulase family glycosylhydrolase [Nitrospira sp. BLG_1]|uniref:cellulase family glycosylhydrolase n=1 Tax=Nitrospira sp. BLG_1 TaxID=3395883 RepID=UPI0039BCB7BD